MLQNKTTRRRFLASATAVPLAGIMQQSTAVLPAEAAETAVVEVKLALPKGSLHLIFYTPRTVRVLFTPHKAPRPLPDFALARHAEKINAHLAENSRHILVKTPHMQVEVEKATGRCRFLNAEGRPLLEETEGAGRKLTPVQFQGKELLEVEQHFVLNRHDAFYGLGQHQQGVMNYSPGQVHLAQSNMHVAVPVLLCSAGYGIFWNNPARTDVLLGADAMQPVPAANLLNGGKPGGLAAQYFEGQNFDTLKTERIDPQIQFDFAASPPQGMKPDNFSVRWTGELTADSSGEYLLQTVSDDGARLWLNNNLLIDNWHVQPASAVSAAVTLQAGVRYPLRIEYFQAGGDAVMQLNWSLPEKTSQLVWKSDAGARTDYFFMAGPALDDVIAEYRLLTGPAPMLGRWSWGFWQCKNRYETQEEILGVAAEYRSLKIPIDGIVQDWFYWSPYPWGSNRFDPVRYPNPHEMIEALHSENIHFMISVWAKFHPGSGNYNRLAAANALLSSQCTDRYYDAFLPEAARIYWEDMRAQLFRLGVDAWWLDASEPELCGQWGEFAGTATAAGPGREVYNAYPLMHTGAVYQGQRETDARKRVMILTRSAWAGQQRHAAITWSGDINGDWGTFARQIPAGLNFCMSGIPGWNTDIGGYISGNPADPAYAQLFVRWFQFGSFCPLFRVHGVNYGKEMWKFGPRFMPILVKYNHLRYRLLPYIYSVAWMVSSAGYTMMRALVFDFQHDPHTWRIADQYLFGPGIMVCPVTQQDAESRSVYLPDGCSWFDFWTGERMAGGRTIQAKAPLHTLPLYVRAGSIVPMGRVVQHAGESPDPLEIRIYPGADAEFALYEDEGDGYEYEKGAFSLIRLVWKEAERLLLIEKRQGSFSGMQHARQFHIVLVRAGHAAGLEEAAPDRVVDYGGASMEIRL